MGEEDADVFGQARFRCRLEWGRRGASAAAVRGDLLVVVDVLSFSSAVATAVAHGGSVYPCATREEAERLAGEIGAEVAVARTEAPGRGRFSLSPSTFLAIEPGTKVAVSSPNGATCSHYGRSVPRLFVGCLLNARAVADAVAEALDATGLSVTILACGERWRTLSDDGDLRFAIEDYLGAGAILSGLRHEKSPEARLCEAAFLGYRSDIETTLRECGSGRELRQKGYPEDVRHAARLNLYDAVPVLRDGILERL